jgi:hypothetical protein
MDINKIETHFIIADTEDIIIWYLYVILKIIE